MGIGALTRFSALLPSAHTVIKATQHRRNDLAIPNSLCLAGSRGGRECAPSVSTAAQRDVKLARSKRVDGVAFWCVKCKLKHRKGPKARDQRAAGRSSPVPTVPSASPTSAPRSSDRACGIPAGVSHLLSPPPYPALAPPANPPPHPAPAPAANGPIVVTMLPPQPIGGRSDDEDGGTSDDDDDSDCDEAFGKIDAAFGSSTRYEGRGVMRHQQKGALEMYEHPRPAASIQKGPMRRVRWGPLIPAAEVEDTGRGVSNRWLCSVVGRLPCTMPQCPGITSDVWLQVGHEGAVRVVARCCVPGCESEVTHDACGEGNHCPTPVGGLPGLPTANVLEARAIWSTVLAQGTDSTLRNYQRASGVPKNLQTESPVFKLMQEAAYPALRRVRNEMMIMVLTIVVTFFGGDGGLIQASDGNWVRTTGRTVLSTVILTTCTRDQSYL